MLLYPSDYGFNGALAPDNSPQVFRGLTYLHVSAEGVHEHRVGRQHPNPECWEVTIMEGPRARSIWVRTEREILADCHTA